MPRLSKEWYALCAARIEAREAGGDSIHPACHNAFIAWAHAMKKAGITYTRVEGPGFNCQTSDGETYLESEPL